MDTSEQYQKMADCPEIQEGYILQTGDYLYAKWGMNCDEPYLSVYTANSNDPYRYGKPLFIPRQDQLQEMVFHCCGASTIDLFVMHSWILFEHEEMEFNDSMEQLWLAFVMHELHSKTWDGERWHS